MATVSRDILKEMVREAVRQALADAPGLESSKPAPSEYFAPWTGASYDAHPSQQKFNINEASNLTSNLLELASLQSCTIEKGKPCDQCGMCRSLGF